MNRETYDTRVRRGAEFLDEHRPGWASRIDLETFCLTDPCECVLGQVEDDYYKGLANLGLPSGIPSDFDGRFGIYKNDKAHDLGFFENSLLENDCDPHRDRRWDDLHETWVAIIRQRRGQVPA